jgi:membrane-associated phospholipid phosphatase
LNININLQTAKQYTWTATWITALFSLVYGYTNYKAQSAIVKYQFYFEWEKSTPLIGWMILPYISLNIMTFAPLFFMIPSEVRRLGRLMGLATIVAGIIFYFFPAPIVYTRPDYVPYWDFLFKIIFTFDDLSNTLPSLHITYTAQIIFCLWHKLNRLRYFFLVWFILICCSVLFTWQHHVLDIFSGIILAAILHKAVKDLPEDSSFRWKL